MAKKTLCTRYAQVKVDGQNKDSKLHKALLEKIANRPVANLVYAMYLQNGIAADMDAKGYQRNTQGQHSVSAVLEYFKFQNIVTDIADSSIKAVEMNKGIRDTNGLLHNFTDPMDAYQKAQEVNKLTNAAGESLHLAAFVVMHGQDFQVLVSPISSSTNIQERNIDDAIFLWKSLNNAMALQGVDLDALREPFSDILNMGTGMINYIESMTKTDNKYLTQREIQFLLSADSSSNLTQTAINRLGGGDLVTAAQAIYENYHVSSSPTYAGLIDNTLAEAKDLFSVLDSNFNAQTINKIASEMGVSPEMQVRKTIKDLNYKYGIDFKEIKLEDKHAKSLSEATARAITILEKRINQLETRAGNKDKIKELSKLHNTLVKELESKRYYMGVLNYLNEASDVINTLEADLTNSAFQQDPSYENAIALARILNNQNMYVDGYSNLFRDLLGDLANIEKLSIDENISQADIDTIKNMAEQAYTTLENLRRRGEELNKSCVRAILTRIMGNSVGPEIIEQIVNMEHIKNWGMDVLYSFGKLSDPLSAAIGDMVRNTQDNRNDDLLKYTTRIREATAMLYDKGSNSEFMYEDDGHILSDYDWNAYQKAYKKQKTFLWTQGIKDFDLEEAMEQWEEANTENLIVDQTNGRTERVPKLSLYRKPGKSFRDKLSPAQNEYYNKMMQIKGEIGSLLPEWAQRQFLPPQLRRDLITALTHIKEDGMEKFGNSFKDKVEELYKVKQDDTEWNVGGVRPASYEFAKGDLSGRESRQIPIFFVNKLNNSDELFKNFSAGVQALAATAENYYHMSDIVDIAEYLRTFIQNSESKIGEEAGGNKTTKITTPVKAGQKYIASLVLNNMFDKHFYNINIKGNPFFTKMIEHTIHYTSFKGLATNTFGAAANLLVGEQQLFQMAVGNTLYKIFTKSKTPYFGITDWMLGLSKLFGTTPGLVAGVGALTAGTGFFPALGIAAGVGATKFVYDKLSGKGSLLLDLITNNKQSEDYLMAEYFDLFNENYGSMMHTNYHKGFRQLLHDISFILYGAGEKAIRYNCLWAMENSQRLIHDGKNITMKQSFQKVGNSLSPHLELKPNLFTVDGVQLTSDTGKLTSEGKDFMRSFKRNLRACCQGMFGAMNEEDKGIIHMHAIGKASMNFRQWMIGHYSERFRGVHWDMDKKEFVRGYYTSSGKFIKEALTTEEAKDLLQEGHKIKFMGQFMKDLLHFRKNWIKQWTKSSDTQKLDLSRLMSAVVMYSLLFGSACWVGGGMVPKLWMGDKDDENRRKKEMDPRRKFLYYQLKRLLFEAESSTPVGAFTNFESLVKSPIPAIRTFDNAMYFITGLGDLGAPLQSGPDKGMDKYWRNILKYNLPFWRDYRRLVEFSESDAMFGMFEDQTLK